MRWMMTKKQRMVILTGLLLVGLLGQASGQALKAVTIEFPPYEYSDGGQANGIAVDIIKEAFKRMGKEISISVVPFARALDSIKSGTADVIFTYYKAPGREAFSDYSTEPLVDQTISLFVSADSTVTFDGDLAKLSDHLFGLVNFSYGAVFDGFKTTLKKVDASADSRKNVEKLAAGRFDIMPSDRWVAYYFLNQLQNAGAGASSPKIKELQPSIETFYAYVGFSKANKLTAIRDTLDTTLKAMRKDGTYDRILASWSKALGK